LSGLPSGRLVDRLAARPLHRARPDVHVAGEQPRLGLQRARGVGKPVFGQLGEGLDHVGHRLGDGVAHLALFARLAAQAAAALPASSTMRARFSAKRSGSLTMYSSTWLRAVSSRRGALVDPRHGLWSWTSDCFLHREPLVDTLSWQLHCGSTSVTRAGRSESPHAIDAFSARTYALVAILPALSLAARQYVFEQVNRLKAAARAAGRRHHRSRHGQSRTADAPWKHIVDKLVETVQDPRTHRYSRLQGHPRPAPAQARYYERRFGVKLDPETQVVATLGSKEGFANMAQAITAPGDVILVPNPTYPIHAFGFIMSGGVIRSDAGEPMTAS
jgi:hypothetical protein